MLIFSISLVLSSFLLFQIQPLIGKYILPWFGSSPSVWSASMLFFQSMLTAGYAYAYALVKRLKFRQQGFFHLLLGGLIFISLIIGAIWWGSPILPSQLWRPEISRSPFISVVAILFVSIGLSYFLLTANSTLMQSWFSNLYPGRSPYRLYALSNLASLGGLLSYPFFFEPNFSLTEQARLWTMGFILYLISLVLISRKVIFSPSGDSVQEAAAQILIDHTQPKKFDRVLWVLLPAIASILLLATTNEITQEIAVIPFLWVIPLSLYLLTFILCFENDRWYHRGRFVLVTMLVVGVFALMSAKGPMIDIRIQIATYCLVLFVGAMVCHGELVQLRPMPHRLAEFYLSISIGGALGGLFVNLIAPVIFKDYWELHFGMLLCFSIYLVLIVRQRRVQPKPLTIISSFSMLVVLVWLLRFSILDMKVILSGSVWMERNFFGVLRVREIEVGEEKEPAARLIHGITVHGLQFQNPDQRHLTTMYYTESSGAGLAILNHPNREKPLKIAVLGLGTGTLAAYGREGDHIRFYEINPDVVRVAEGEGGYFSYINDSQAFIEIILGDARLSLEREWAQNGSQNYDLILVDTFSSDSIPVHLITREAFNLYFRHLKTDGILAIHISNNHLDLEPVVLSMAENFSMRSALVASGKTREGSSAAVWILLTLNETFLDADDIRFLEVDPAARDRTIRLWTDDYSNLFQILR